MKHDHKTLNAETINYNHNNIDDIQHEIQDITSFELPPPITDTIDANNDDEDPQDF